MALKAFHGGGAVRRLPLLAAAFLLAACSGQVADADMERLQAEMKASYKQHAQKIVLFKLSSDSATQVSGMIHVQFAAEGETHTFYTTCLAKLDPSSRKFDWHCDAVP
jgi:outer membrane PBP1 activator LpoA protein